MSSQRQGAQVCMSALLSLAAIWTADAAIAQLGERQTEDLKVPGSIPGLGTLRRALPFAHQQPSSRGAISRDRQFCVSWLDRKNFSCARANLRALSARPAMICMRVLAA